jgi:hypothetical protein
LWIRVINAQPALTCSFARHDLGWEKGACKRLICHWPLLG